MKFDIFVQSKLPSELVSAANVEHLTGIFSNYKLRNGAAALEAALRFYGKSVDLLKVMNLELKEGLPDLYFLVRPPRSDGGRETCNRIAPTSPTSPFPRLRVAICDKTEKPVSIISVPLHPIFSNFPCLTNSNVVYAHTFSERLPATQFLSDRTGRSYVGITKRGWASRWRQHLSDARNGSPYRFHQAIREFGQTHIECHQVLACNLSFDDAMAFEEDVVAEYSLYPHGLNMIPGGHAGLRYLAKYGFHANQKRWEDRHAILRKFGEHCQRGGRPNPLAAARWRDDDFAASVICANPNNFSRDAIQEARLLQSLEWQPEQIAARLNCNATRVRRLLRGATYSRVQ